MELHILKSLPEHFHAVRKGLKRAELRVDDRGFQVGDILALLEYDEETRSETGNVIISLVTHIYRGEYLLPGWAMLSLGEVMHGFINFEDEDATPT